MTAISRREILATLGSIGAIAAVPGFAQASQPAIDLSAGQGIGKAYLAAHPRISLAKLHRTLLRRGLDREAVSQLRSRAAADFGQGRVFIYEGWRMSETEAQLFALLGSAFPR